MSGHTKGPWFVDRDLGRTTISAACNRQLAIFTVTNGDRETAEANARLGAAAPEMLEVLKVYAEFDNCSNVDDRGTCTPERQCICCRARAAAAKAEGRQP